MMGSLAPVILAAVLFFDFQAYRYGFAVASRCGIDALGAVMLGAICLGLANVVAGLLALAASRAAR